MSTIAVDNARPSAGGTSYSLTSGVAKAWVNFNGTGTVSIRESYNVGSITDNGTGDYTVGFSDTIANSDYCAVGAGKGEANLTITANNNTTMFLPAIYQTTSLRVFLARDGASGPKDSENANCSIFGDLA